MEKYLLYSDKREIERSCEMREKEWYFGRRKIWGKNKKERKRLELSSNLSCLRHRLSRRCEDTFFEIIFRRNPQRITIKEDCLVKIRSSEINLSFYLPSHSQTDFNIEAKILTFNYRFSLLITSVTHTFHLFWSITCIKINISPLFWSYFIPFVPDFFPLSKSESVKFSLIESLICLFTDSSVKK